jgi:Flp pilus assembly protein TadB
MRKALAAGTLISMACFTLVFWAVSRLLPLILSPLFEPVAYGFFLFAVASGPLIYLRKRRRKTNAAYR